MGGPEQAMDGIEHGEGLASQGQKGRANPRYSVDEDAVLALVSHGMSLKARVIDLSLDGCRVRTGDRFIGKPGRPVEITFKVKGCAFRFSGVVRWSDGQHLVGIHFENMIPRRKAELTEVIEEMAAAAAARAQAAHQPITTAVTPAPAVPEPKAVAAQPAELKAAKASEPPLAVTGSHTPVAAKARDRREQARHAVDTSATIFLVRVGSALQGHIVDLSIGGCRIRTDERFPVGIYTRVEIEFYLQGLPFRLGGVIQAIHDRFMVGIRFLDLGERKRQQVLDLIDEIEEMRAAMPHEEASSPQRQDPA
jgi:hypothetical protein